VQKQKLYPILESESGEMCDFLHTSNHHYFDGDNKGPLSDGRPAWAKYSHSGGALVGKTRDLDGRSSFRHYGRWPFPWRSEDDWGPITAAVVLFIILSVLIYSGVTVFADKFNDDPSQHRHNGIVTINELEVG
jgi:hypothetical protein